jgi:hypothetical protein
VNNFRVLSFRRIHADYFAVSSTPSKTHLGGFSIPYPDSKTRSSIGVAYCYIVLHVASNLHILLTLL